MRQSSWTGSEDQREPQGTCSANGYVTPAKHRFNVPAGTDIKVKSVADGMDWRPYRTKQAVGFARYEWTEENGRVLVFRESGYWLRVARSVIVYG